MKLDREVNGKNKKKNESVVDLSIKEDTNYINLNNNNTISSNNNINNNNNINITLSKAATAKNIKKEAKPKPPKKKSNIRKNKKLDDSLESYQDKNSIAQEDNNNHVIIEEETDSNNEITSKLKALKQPIEVLPNSNEEKTKFTKKKRNKEPSNAIDITKSHINSNNNNKNKNGCLKVGTDFTGKAIKVLDEKSTNKLLNISNSNITNLNTRNKNKNKSLAEAVEEKDKKHNNINKKDKSYSKNSNKIIKIDFKKKDEVIFREKIDVSELSKFKFTAYLIFTNKIYIHI